MITFKKNCSLQGSLGYCRNQAFDPRFDPMGLWSGTSNVFRVHKKIGIYEAPALIG